LFLPYHFIIIFAVCQLFLKIMLIQKIASNTLKIIAQTILIVNCARFLLFKKKKYFYKSA